MGVKKKYANKTAGQGRISRAAREIYHHNQSPKLLQCHFAGGDRVANMVKRMVK